MTRGGAHNLTLAGYIDLHYWPTASRRLQASTLDTYAQDMRNHIRPWLGALKLNDVDRRAIQCMLDWCATEKVARKALSTLKTILNEAVGDGLIAVNPACAKYAFPPKGGHRDNGLILGDFAQIVQFVDRVQDGASEPILRLVASGLLLGLRPEERYALDYEDFDFAAMTVTVRSAYVKASSTHGGVQMKPTKTELSTRIIPIPRKFAQLFGDCRGHGPWITSEGHRMSPNTAQKQWRRYLDAHPRLPRVTLENMRHSFATACLHNGMHVEDLSRMLGHSSINTTYARYVRPDLHAMREGLSTAMRDCEESCGDARKSAFEIRVIPGQRRYTRSSILRASTSEDDA